MPMSPIIVLLSIFIGSSAGLLYGLLFITQKNKIPFSESAKKQIWYHRITSILLSFLRIALLAAGWYYILRSPTIPFILILVSFLAGFWLVITK